MSWVGPSLACRYAALLRALVEHLSIELSSLLSYVRVLIFGLVSDDFLKADIYKAFCILELKSGFPFSWT